jgi:hypothetical protein
VKFRLIPGIGGYDGFELNTIILFVVKTLVDEPETDQPPLVGTDGL